MSAHRAVALSTMLSVPLLFSCASGSGDDLAPATVNVADTLNAFVPRWSPDGTRLVLAQVIEGRSAIMVRNADGSNPVRLTHGVWDSNPLWSPDGQWIAYTAESPDFDLMLVSASGGEPRTLTSEPGYEQAVGWLADGSGIIYQQSGDREGTFVVNLADGARRPLVTVDGDVEAQLSPDGKMVAYELSRGDGKITVWVWDSGTDQHRQLTFEGREGMDQGTAWSPDSRSLLFRSTHTGTPDLWVADVASGALRQLTTDVQADYLGRWSPDGQWVAFASGRGGQTDLWVMPSAGGDATRVTNDRAIEINPSWTPDGHGLTYSGLANITQVRTVPVAGGEPTVLSFQDYNANGPRVSPDGATVVFESDRSGNTDIWSVPAGGGDPRPLTTSALGDDQPDWAPDGKSIGFSSNRRGSNDIFVMADTGGEARLLVDWPETRESTPRFSPDGRTIAFSSTRDARTTDVWIVPAAGGSPKRLTMLDAGTTVQDWSPDGKFLLVRTGYTSGALYRVPVSGGAPQLLRAPPGADAARWSPDGRTIAFLNIEGGYSHIGIVPATGGETTMLTADEQAYDLSPRWSPDGTQLAYEVFDYAHSTEDVVVMTLADKSVRHVTSTPERSENQPQWMPDGKSLLITSTRRGQPIVTVDVTRLLSQAAGRGPQ